PDLAADAVLDSLQGDKKVRDGRLRFVMPTSIGTVEIRDDVSRDEILSCLERLKG
ncbi:MAG: 3-dehydroquinate synthase, partial [Synechococcus sp. MOX_bin32]|nr:3-dehydroquinate synthase [Synechococcus sp. MOX_bin32]